MSQGYVLSRNTPTGYLVSVSGKKLESKNIKAMIKVIPSHIDVIASFEDNYRPHVLFTGTVDEMRGDFAPEVDSVQLDEPVAVIMHYELSDNEIAELALKGYFNKGYPVQDVLVPAFEVTHEVPVLVFDEAEIPIIVVNLREHETICVDSNQISKELIKEFIQFSESVAKIDPLSFANGCSWQSEMLPEIVEEQESTMISYEEVITDEPEPIEEPQENKRETEIDEIIETTLQEMTNPPEIPEWIPADTVGNDLVTNKKEPSDSSACETQIPDVPPEFVSDGVALGE